MHKKFIALFVLLATLVAAVPCSAKKRHIRRKKIHTTCIKHTRKSTLSCKSPHKNPSAPAPTKTGAAPTVTPCAPVPTNKITPSASNKRPCGRHKKKRTCIVRRRKIRHATLKNIIPPQKHYTPEQCEKIAKLRTMASFIWPIKQSQFYLSSPYGPRRNPNGTLGFHTGIDMAAPKGTPVMAVADGIVLAARPYRGYGNMIFLGHRKKLFTRYAHLNRILVKEGEIVHKGMVIGHVGNTGRVRRGKGGDGSHLHWETYIKNKRVNPRLFV